MFFVSLLLCATILSFGQEKWDNEQKQIIGSMNKLSETTALKGGGAEAYGWFLSDDFSRWTIGSSTTNSKKDWVHGIREWFDDGWRVSDRKQQLIEIQMMNGLAHTRRIVSETYLGPDGTTSKSKAALNEIWIKEKDKWVLYRVNIHPMEAQ